MSLRQNGFFYISMVSLDRTVLPRVLYFLANQYGLIFARALKWDILSFSFIFIVH